MIDFRGAAEPFFLLLAVLLVLTTLGHFYLDSEACYPHERRVIFFLVDRLAAFIG